MLEWISWFVIGVIYYFSNIYITKSFFDKPILRHKFDIIVIGILVSIINLYFIVNSDSNIKMLINVIFNVIALKYIFREKNSKLIMTTLFLYIVYAITEIIFTLIFVYIVPIELHFWTDNVLGIIIANLVVVLVTILIFKINKVQKFVKDIISWYLTKGILNDILVISLVITTLLFFIKQNYQEIENINDFLFLLIFFFGVVIFITGYFKEKTNNNKLTSEYDQLLQYVKTYEEVIEEKSKNQHEYQNQLILIKEMLGARNKKVRDHISELLEIEDQTEKYNWLNKLKNIPNGGLKGLIHYKITEMMKKDIKLYVDINDNVNNKRINKYLNDNLHDISKIIGVYIDNAIEAAVDSKQRYIIIEAMIENNKLDFSVSNTYSGTIDFNSIDKEGYSKKGKGRGYGLSLVQDIINRRKDIDQYREFNGIFFVQKTTFQYKK